MKIDQIQIKRLEIPFNVNFKHSSAERNITESVLVKVRSAEGSYGLGEGCPRSYVTGETVGSVISFFEKHKLSIQQIRSLSDLSEWMTQHHKSIDNNLSAWCAIELALLDVLAKEEGKSVEDLLSLPRLSGEFRYTAVLGVNNLDVFEKQLQQYIYLGFSDFKIKVSGKLEQDKQNLELITNLVKNVRIRIDANNLWTDVEEAIDYLKKLEKDFWAVEEPIDAKQYDLFRQIATVLDTKILLDESFIVKEQFNHLQTNTDQWIVNVRISKMGGILRSLDIAQTAKKMGIPIIVGAQVGETSILTRAALTVASTFRDILLAQEGGFGTYLLKHDIVEPSLMIGKGAKLSIDSITDDSGFGLDYLPTS